MHSWRILLLPYLDQVELYDQYDFSQPWDSPTNQRLAASMPLIYAFTGDHEPGVVTTNYLAVTGPHTAWPGASSTTEESITDDHPTTIRVVENVGQSVHWMEPRDLPFDSISLRVNDPQGLSSKYLSPGVLMVDGSLRHLDEGLPEDVFRAMLTADGGEQLTREGDTWHLMEDGRLRPERKEPLDADP